MILISCSITSVSYSSMLKIICMCSSWLQNFSSDKELDIFDTKNLIMLLHSSNSSYFYYSSKKESLIAYASYCLSFLHTFFFNLGSSISSFSSSCFFLRVVVFDYLFFFIFFYFYKIFFIYILIVLN